MATSYEAVIGLEVHAQLRTQTKLFCGCATAYGASPNTQVCPVCLGLPGALPVPNAHAVSLALRAGLGLGCQVRAKSQFARKNYFYPDLSKGYQISQFELPIHEWGELEVKTETESSGEPQVSKVRIRRIHMEEDAAKNVHGAGQGQHTVVDFNRAGVPLIEIVTEPDLRSSAEAEAYLRQLREVLLYLGVNDGNLEEGSFRCDANVSIRPVGSETLGTRAELKNINSFRFVRKAIDYEIARQEAVVSGGGTIVQETRTWVEDKGVTASMRGKEEAHDYRYFPDPDLPPVVLSEAEIEAARAALPELPDARRARFMSALGLTAYDAQVLTAHPDTADYYEATLAAIAVDASEQAKRGKLVANFVQAELLGLSRVDGATASFPVTPEALGGLLKLVADDTINGKIAKQVFQKMVQSGEDAKTIVAREGLAQVTDTGAIEATIDEILGKFPDQLAQFREGKAKMQGFFVGQVMKASGGKANPQLVNEILSRKLKGEG